MANELNIGIPKELYDVIVSSVEGHEVNIADLQHHVIVPGVNDAYFGVFWIKDVGMVDDSYRAVGEMKIVVETLDEATSILKGLRKYLEAHGFTVTNGRS